MGLYSISGRSTIAPTAVRPGFSLMAVANRRAVVREIGIYNTTATATTLAIARITAAGTPGTGLTEAKIGDSDAPDAECTGFAGHTGDATIGDELVRAALGAAIGSGAVWVFDEGIRIPPGTANGVGCIAPSGITGQIVDYYLIWTE